MLKIRLYRVGKKNQPSFKIVVTKKSNPPHRGRFKEEVGFYNPLTKEKELKEERIKYWLSVGAQPSDTVYNLLVEKGIIEGEKKKKHSKTKKKKEEKEQEKTEKKEESEKEEEKKEEKAEKKEEKEQKEEEKEDDSAK